MATSPFSIFPPGTPQVFPSALCGSLFKNNTFSSAMMKQPATSTLGLKFSGGSWNTSLAWMGVVKWKVIQVNKSKSFNIVDLLGADGVGFLHFVADKAGSGDGDDGKGHCQNAGKDRALAGASHEQEEEDAEEGRGSPAHAGADSVDED